MLEKILKIFIGDKHEREKKKNMPVVEEINRIYESLKDLTDDDLRERSLALKEKIGSIEDVDQQERACPDRDAVGCDGYRLRRHALAGGD